MRLIQAAAQRRPSVFWGVSPRCFAHLPRGQGLVFLIGILLLAATAGAERLDADAPRHGQPAQERARLTARELATSVLEVQLRQLRENGLESLPLYRDLFQMRANIDGLVEAELRDVVEALVTAQQAAGAEREQAFAEARRRVRRTVVKLALERHGLERRLKTAALAARIRRLIKALESSLNRSETAPRDEVAERQQAVLRRLELLLEKVESARGSVEADRETTLERVREIAARQAKLRAETAERELADASVDALVRRQAGIHQALAELARPLRHTPSAEAFLKQARDAAFAASGHLFELAASEALAEQDSVSANLAQIDERLVTAAQLDGVDKRPAEYTQLANELSRVLVALGPSDEPLAEILDDVSTERSITAGSDLPAGRPDLPVGRPDQPAGRPRDWSREPWFAELPSEVRRAIRSQARRPVPRGYEERLRRYFESLD